MALTRHQEAQRDAETRKTGKDVKAVRTALKGSQARLKRDEIDFSRLAQAVILHAVRDAEGGDLSALEWLESAETGETFGTLAGVRWEAVVSWCRQARKEFS